MLRVLNRRDVNSFKIIARNAAKLACLKGEPEAPIMHTQIPGPKSIQLKKDLAKIQVKYRKTSS